MSDTPEWDDVVEQLARPRILELEAEIERLQLENTSLELEVSSWMQSSNLKVKEIEQLRTIMSDRHVEINELRAEIERLHAELAEWERTGRKDEY